MKSHSNLYDSIVLLCILMALLQYLYYVKIAGCKLASSISLNQLSNVEFTAQKLLNKTMSFVIVCMMASVVVLLLMYRLRKTFS